MSIHDRVAELSSDKRRLLALLMKEKSGGRSPSPMARRPRHSNIQPVSFAQQRFWFLNQLEPDSAFHAIPVALRLSGPLDLMTLEKTFSELIRRHEILRTLFPQINGQPVQLIQDARPLSLRIVDLSDLPVPEPDEQARQLTVEEAQQPFDLAQGPLFRTQVIRLSAEEHIILSTMHHIISDGWSMGVMINEVAALYAAFANGNPSPLPELPLQYADYAIWQREFLSGEVLEGQLSYWKRQLAGAPAVLNLPADRPRPANPTYQGSDESIIIPEELTGKIRKLCRQQEATPFMLLLATYQALLYRYTHQSDICVGAPVTNRNRTEIENLIGLFVNTLVMRTDLSGEPTFNELLKRVKSVALNAYAHQDLPFEKLVEKLNPDRSLNQISLFQVLFNMENAQGEQNSSRDLGGLKFEFLAPEINLAKYDLTLTVKEGTQTLAVNLRYNTDLFNQSTAQRMLEHFRNLLEAIVAEPDQPITQLPLLSDAERHKILIEWNDTARSFPTDKRLHDLFEDQAGQTPNATALVFEDRELTYGELNRRANQLARYLKNTGVGPEVIVGVMMERSVELIVALLGVLKAGGACLPIDPMYPGARIGYMLEDAKVSALLTQRRLVGSIPELRVATICCDDESSAIADESDENLESGADSDNTAYVLYTSGSTGQPKGVLLPHRGLVNRMFAGQSVYHPLTEQGRFLHKTSIGFDVSIWETFFPFLVGGRLVLASPGGQGDTAYLAQLIAKQQVSFLHFVPSVLQRFLEEPEIENCGSLKAVFSGGEALPVPLMKRFFDRSRAKLCNQYGPTEASINSTYLVCQRDHDLPAMTIGRPLPNNQIYVLDKWMQPAPVGVAGELYIGGESLTRGYLNQPGLTAERFVPHPFSSLPGARLYRTGDLARFWENGEIEFIGRRDHQVKVRGYRIELGEIETALRSHQLVREAVVLAGRMEDDNRLVAYVAANGTLDSVELRRHLRQQLPDYMIPAAFVFLNSLPLTANGKVDRQALPASDQFDEAQPQSRTGTDREDCAPNTPAEELLIGIWSQLLKLDRVGLHDNFFDLGGHSLLATQVMFRVRESLGVELPLRALFDRPTIAALGQEIEAAMRSKTGAAAKPILPVDRTQPLPLSFAQHRLWFLDQLEPGSPFYNVPTAMRIRGPFSLPVFQQTLSEIVRRHESLRTVFQQKDGLPVQIIKPAQPVTVPVTDLSGYPAEEREEMARQFISAEGSRPFDLAAGPLLRVQALKLGPEEYIVLSTAHHIVSDGWSMGVMIGEVAALYEAYRKGEESPLSELPAQYGDYAVWQRERMTGEILEEQLAYWRKQLAGASSLALPTDRPRPPVQTYRGASQRVLLDEELSGKIKQMCQAEGVTLFMFLMAALNVLLYRYSGQTDIVIGTAVAGRTRSEVENLIGFFVNSLALRTRIAAGMTFLDLLKDARRTFLDGYAHQELPFEKVVEELAPERAASRAPLFQVMFALQSGPQTAAPIENLTLSPIKAEIATAKFDLTLVMANTGRNIHGSFEYNTDLFDAQTMEKMAGHFQRLLLSAVNQPESELKAMEMFSEEEKTLLNTPLTFEELDHSFSF